MTTQTPKRQITVPAGSTMTPDDYRHFLQNAYQLIAQLPQYLAPSETIDALELAHLIPPVKETALAIYVGINDAACSKALVTALLPHHGHNNVFVFDNQIYSGRDDVPAGTADARQILNGFTPPNDSWNTDWTYVMIQDPQRTFQSLWKEKGYVDMIPAKFEDFTMLTHPDQSKLCTFIDPKAFQHPINQTRPYLKQARQRGQQHAHEFHIPADIADEFKNLEPVILHQGEKLYVATNDFGPCAHGWSNTHPDNKTLAVVNENSAVPLDLVIAKPPVQQKYAQQLKPALGSADMTTDWFHRGLDIVRLPLLGGLFKG